MMTWQTFGDPERAFTAVDGMMQDRPQGNLGFLWLPPFDPLRDDPRFRELLERLNLEDAEVQRTRPDVSAAP